MQQVSKIPLTTDDEQKVTMPAASLILGVDEDHGRLIVWVYHDADAPDVEETFYVITTGQEVPDTFNGLYVGSQTLYASDDEEELNNNPRIEEWHVFFKRKPNVHRGRPVVVPTDPGAPTDTRGAH